MICRICLHLIKDARAATLLGRSVHPACKEAAALALAQKESARILKKFNLFLCDTEDASTAWETAVL
jgi:hypothetical protein